MLTTIVLRVGCDLFAVIDRVPTWRHSRSSFGPENERNNPFPEGRAFKTFFFLFRESLSLQAQDIVCVEAVLADGSSGTRWVVDATRGMLVKHPNTLISGTAVVGSLFCKRRSVLADSYRSFEGGSEVMAVGTMVHEILQEVRLNRGGASCTTRKLIKPQYNPYLT